MPTNDTIEVEHNGETISVPTVFKRTDLAAWFGGVPVAFEVDRVFVYRGGLHVESWQGDGEWVEAARHTDDYYPTFNAKRDRGWVAEIVHAPEDGEDPGETVWER